MSLPIRLRMTLWYVAVLATIIVAIGAFLVVRLRADLTDAVDRTLGPAAAQIAAGYRAEGAPEFRDKSAELLSGERVAAQVLGAPGAVLLAHGDPVARAPIVDPGGARTGTARLGPRREDFRFAAVPVTRAGRQELVVAAESLAGVERSVHQTRVLILLAGPAALLAAAAAGWWLAGRALRPIERMTSTAERIGVTGMQERVPDPGTADEVAHLARTLNTMLDRVETGVAEQRRLVADTSHELRTPLAAMRSELDVSLRTDSLGPAAREVLASAREEVDRMSRTVDDLLTLATADEGGLALVLDPVDLRGVAAAVVASLEPLSLSRGVRLELAGEPARTRGDADRLAHALRNLADNAIKFSPVGGTVRVTTWTRGEEAGITVTDEGPGIAPELRERVFHRFYRADPSRTRRTGGGSGLGLSIVREIARSHRGRAWIDGGAAGGSAASIALPRGAD